jgi:hypothetical protein
MSFSATYYIFTAVSPSNYVLSSYSQTGNADEQFVVADYSGLTDTNDPPNASYVPTNASFTGWSLANPPNYPASYEAGMLLTFTTANFVFFAVIEGKVGSGSAGTCFSGGAGSGGTFGVPDQGSPGTDSAGINGGFGTIGNNYTTPSQNRALAGAGNPGGTTDGTADGTGGVLILFVEGTITKEGGTPSTTKYFTANGREGKQVATFSTRDLACKPFGGGSGGGIVIVVNNGASSLTNNVQAAGGIISADGPAGATNFRSGGNGAAVAYTFSQV